MEAQRLVFKLYAEPNTVPAHEFTKVFHQWIQTRRLDEVVIDVTDYSHVHNGPGVVLICHAANYSVDTLDERLGVTFNRKRDVAGTLSERLTSALRSTLSACRLLEEDPALSGKLRFSTNEILFRANDRLLAPNSADTHAIFEPELRSIATRLYGADPAVITRTSDLATELFTLRVRATGGPPNVAGLLERL
jgi:hypothetical protein